jgi:hypothetical protein
LFFLMLCHRHSSLAIALKTFFNALGMLSMGS